MKILVLCLIALAIADKFDQFRAFDQDEFGRTLIDTLQMQMSTGEPIARFIEIMRNLETSIENEQKEDDKANNEYQNQCTEDIKVLQQESANLERRTVEIQSILDELEPLRSYKQGQADAKNAWKVETEKKLADLVKKRETEKAEFDKKVEEHDYATFVIETVRRMFSDKNQSFLQMNNEAQWQKVRDYFINASEQAKKFEIKKSYSKMFNVFAEIANAAQAEDFQNSPTVNRIVNLCDLMLKQIEDSKALETKAEQKRLNMFVLEKGNFDKDLTSLNNALAQLTAAILGLDNRIQDQKRDLSDYNARLDAKNKQSEDRGGECREKAYNYQLTREKREQKRQLVSQIIGAFSANQRDFAEYVKLRGQAGDFRGKNFQVLGNPTED
ncbi:unnamed protein product (macronuclear) [Paramecium tetraurelia]|uniref:Uncharacterized protein n=1 Tax=Paramecium tetraurelia TaxID=5888 RepID=A0BN65_PARTE|nr:uncharacterized protein GSPATT00030620001 [Paramecium tetraurelia]CAK59982.1 unnamed protein product [Paramecium tetraurelia]|eukprot:XP_001427380.1 hypothetical protein (macronuclear) [Paramecium tetraurelia strain d4-2]